MPDGLVERKWQSITAMARSFLAEAKFPKKFWFWAIREAAIHNTTLTKTTQNFGPPLTLNSMVRNPIIASFFLLVRNEKRGIFQEKTIEGIYCFYTSGKTMPKKLLNMEGQIRLKTMTRMRMLQ